MGQEDVGDAVDSELVEMVEDVTAAEVDQDGGPAPADEIDVDGVRESEDVWFDLHERRV
jgi:hypothetical protein